MNYLYSVSYSKGEPDFPLKHIPGAAAHEDAEEAVFQAEFSFIVIEAHSRLGEREADLPLLPGGKCDTLIVLELLDRTHEAGRYILDIELRDLGSRALAGVFQRYGNLQRIRRLLHAQIVIGEVRIAQAVAEGIERVPGGVQIMGLQ